MRIQNISSTSALHIPLPLPEPIFTSDQQTENNFAPIAKNVAFRQSPTPTETTYLAVSQPNMTVPAPMIDVGSRISFEELDLQWPSSNVNARFEILKKNSKREKKFLLDKLNFSKEKMIEFQALNEESSYRNTSKKKNKIKIYSEYEVSRIPDHTLHLPGLGSLNFSPKYYSHSLTTADISTPKKSMLEKQKQLEPTPKLQVKFGIAVTPPSSPQANPKSSNLRARTHDKGPRKGQLPIDIFQAQQLQKPAIAMKSATRRQLNNITEAKMSRPTNSANSLHNATEILAQTFYQRAPASIPFQHQSWRLRRTSTTPQFIVELNNSPRVMVNKPLPEVTHANHYLYPYRHSQSWIDRELLTGLCDSVHGSEGKFLPTQLHHAAPSGDRGTIPATRTAKLPLPTDDDSELDDLDLTLRVSEMVREGRNLRKSIDSILKKQESRREHHKRVLLRNDDFVFLKLQKRVKEFAELRSGI
ncbi:hypothetical protein HK096_010130 [Nowakowskiella sp. JEL0078]|nr:hypothetical protein HK096_010130 [Nowakowskiella sp. JEL0078]